MSETDQPIFSIEKLYVKDLSLEVPDAPGIFNVQDPPQIELQIHSRGESINENVFHVVLTVTATARAAEKTLFLVEVAQAGIFYLRHIPAQEIDFILSVACPNILFPYVRETISSLVNRAGFPSILLAPVNFEMLYQQQRAAEQAPADGKVQLQ